MELIETFVLLVIGFVAFFATGIDDTVAYAGSYLDNPKKDHKKLISFGIIIGTVIALGISIFAGSLMMRIPSRRLIGGAVLVTLGVLSFTHGKGVRHQKKSHYEICSGVMIATFVSLMIAHSLSDKLKKFPHPERIGGVVIIIIGILLALKIL